MYTSKPRPEIISKMQTIMWLHLYKSEVLADERFRSLFYACKSTNSINARAEINGTK